jgi:hypothetical protein
MRAAITPTLKHLSVSFVRCNLIENRTIVTVPAEADAIVLFLELMVRQKDVRDARDALEYWREWARELSPPTLNS